MQWMEPANEVSREMQYEGSPMSMSSVRSAWTEQLLGIFIDLCSISSTWSPLWLLLLLLFLLLLLLLLCCYCSRLNCCLCVQSRAKQSSVSIGLDFICAPFCSLLKELMLPSCQAAWLPDLCPKGTRLTPNAHSSQQQQLEPLWSTASRRKVCK